MLLTSEPAQQPLYIWAFCFVFVFFRVTFPLLLHLPLITVTVGHQSLQNEHAVFLSLTFMLTPALVFLLQARLWGVLFECIWWKPRFFNPLLAPDLLAHCFLKDLPQFTVLQPVYGKGTGHCWFWKLWVIWQSHLIQTAVLNLCPPGQVTKPSAGVRIVFPDNIIV